MKPGLLLVLMVLACSAVGVGQGFVEVSTARTIIDTASVTWDSNYVGSGRLPKVLEVLNEGTPNLYVSLESRDTAAGRYFIVKQNEKLRIDRLVETAYIRAKSASSTAIYRINILR